jgi:CheY-like chemotaxis protein
MLLAAALADLRRSAAAEARARRAAEAASAERIRLLTMISHDVRTPLAGMIGVLDVLQRGALRPEQARLVDLASRAGATLTILVNDILDVARADAGRIALVPAAFDPARSLADVVEIHRERATAAGLDLAIAGLETWPAFVLGDRARFEQLFGNLVVNAVAYTPAGSITVTATRDPAAGLVVTVADTGPGIDPDRLPTLFDAFVPAGPGHRSSGLGLGLHICQRLAELMGGSIAYRPAPGGGSEFRVALPLPAVAAPAALPPAAADPGQRVLLVDDDAIAREVTAAQLAARGHAVTVAADGEAALAAAARATFDLILLDIRLGGDPDGIAVARRLPRRPGLVVVALTGDGSAETRAGALAAGMDGVILKPFAMPRGLAEAVAAARLPVPAG